MANKNIYSRIQQKHDIESNWNNAKTFIPLAGEIVIYDVDPSYPEYPCPRFKIGDGETLLIDLPFIGGAQVSIITWEEND